MNAVVKIPSVQSDNRIGSVFNSLFNVIHATENINIYDDVIWDFSDVDFIHPFYVCGLSLYRYNCDRNILIRGLSESLRGYLSVIEFDSPLLVKTSDEIKLLANKYIGKSYIPVCKFDTSEESIDTVTSSLQKIIQRQCNIQSKMISPLSYLIGELVTNIHDHSKCEHGFMFSQFLKNENILNLCIADYGITVYGSFIKSKMASQEWMNNEALVLDKALNHISTKNLPDAENRGYGLPTSKSMLVDGMGGEFFILSGGAFHRHDKNGKSTVALPKSIFWNGTIVLMKIPVDIPINFNYLNYTERL